jgi:ferredoxin
MKAVRGMLDEAGFDRARYHEESFSFEALQQESQPQTAPENAPAATGFEVNFQKSMRQITCGPQQHVLDAARNAGVRLASSCAQGMCGTCKVKLVSGTVDMQHKGGIRQREIDQGMVLLCCSKPLSNLVVDK